MAKIIQPGLDISELVTQAAQLFAGDPSHAVARLVDAAGASLDAAGGAVYQLLEDGELSAVGGRDSRLLRDGARAALAARRAALPGPVHTAELRSEGDLLGVWAVALPGETDLRPWQTLSHALAPFLALGLRHLRLQDQAAAAQAQVDRCILEVATVYEIGQAMDKVEIDRLLDMITVKAAAVMDAQTCSLLLKYPDSNSLFIAASHGLPDEVVENTRIFYGEGIAGRVAAIGEPVRLGAVADDPRFQDIPLRGDPDVLSSMCMPMKDENGNVQGVLCIRRRAPSPAFTDEDLRLFSIFATQAASAIINAQLYFKLSRKLQEMSTVSALTETITSTLDLDQVLNQVADNIVDVVHFDRCRIYLCDIETGRFSPRIVRGFPWTSLAPEDTDIALGSGVIGLVAQRQMPILADDLDNTLPTFREYARSLGMETFYAQPIVTRGRCIGVVVVSNAGPHRPITPGSTELLKLFVDQAGIAIENARFYASQERRYAELTTLYEFSKTLAATSGVQNAAQTINDLAIKITDSDAGLLLMFDSGQEGLSALDWRGVSEPLGKRLRSFEKPIPAAASARALRTPRLLEADDAERLLGPEWQPICEAFLARHRATALVPLVVEEAAVGFLMLGKQGTDYGNEELRLISVASSQAAAVLSSASHYERRIGQQELELSAVRELMQKVRSAMTEDEALNSILDIVANLVWSDDSALLMVDEDGAAMTVRAARGERASRTIGKLSFLLDDDSIQARALRERKAHIMSDPLIETGPAAGDDPPESATRPRSVMAIPLAVGDELIGVLMLESNTPDVYTEETITILMLVASQAATIYREMSSLRNLTRYTDNILNSITAGVITIDKKGCIVTWNRRAEEIINLRAHQIIGRHYSEFIQMLQVESAVREETMRMVELTAQTGKVFHRNKLCYQSPQGDEVYVDLSASQLRSESGEYLGIVVVFEDITGEIQNKEELERVSKLAETGQLAANIAHELRNPLSSIKGAAQLLRNEMPTEYVDQHGEFLDIIVEEVNGLNRITSEFLEFSRVTPPEMQPVCLNLLLGRLLQFMNAYLQDQDVTLVLSLDDSLPQTYADKSQIEQVVRNIVINAAQAMPHGGTLTVETRYHHAQDIAEISFTDTGVGIPANKLEKVFTPFFTTKTKGTGLGLAIAQKIVVDTHSGRLGVRSTPGQGSTFTIHLPVSPLYANMIAHARQEITEQRSDQPGGIYEVPTPDGEG